VQQCDLTRRPKKSWPLEPLIYAAIVLTLLIYRAGRTVRAA
jgi:hypothetical protein